VQPWRAASGPNYNRLSLIAAGSLLMAKKLLVRNSILFRQLELFAHAAYVTIQDFILSFLLRNGVGKHIPVDIPLE
jgi:hypothetical protein